MRRRPDELISWLFRAQEFPTGVALLTGTSIVPPAELTLRPGDRVLISITGDDGRGLGALENVVEMVENRDGAALQGGRAAL
jgi:2-dehydro-3-deoxy-D-arabinonate dehydratase